MQIIKVGYLIKNTTKLVDGNFFSITRKGNRARLAKTGAILGELQFALGAGQLSRNTGVVTAGGIHRPSEGFEQRFDNMVRFITVEKFQMEIATSFVGKTLEKFAGKPETESAGSVLLLLHFGNLLETELI